MIDTPPMQTNIAEAVGYNAEKDGGQQILESIFQVPHNTPKCITMVIDRLRIP